MADAQPETVQSLLNRASKASKEQRFDEAEQAYVAATKIQPNNPEIYDLLATAIAWQPNAMFEKPEPRLERMQRAAAAYRKAIELDPTAWRLTMLAHFLINESIQYKESVRVQFRNEAESLFRRALLLEPHEGATLAGLGSIAVQNAMAAAEQGRRDYGPILEDGIKKLQLLLQLNADDEGAMRTLAALYERRAPLARAPAEKASDLALAVTWNAKAKAIDDFWDDAVKNPPFGSYTSESARLIRDVHSIRVRPEEQALKLANKPDAVYPKEAMQAGISGKVQFAVNINLTGQVSTARLLSGNALLVPAALEAVKHYVYKETMVSNHGVRVDTEVEVPVERKR